MRVMIVGATVREESSYNAARVLAEMVAGEHGVIYEVFLPKNLPNFCDGCGECVARGEEHCPNRKYVETIESAMNDSQVVIFATPTFNQNMPASLKNFFDHFSFRWVEHRPNGYMWNKQGVIVASDSFGGSRFAVRGIWRNLLHWGMAEIHSLRFRTSARMWQEMTAEERRPLAKRLERLAKRLLRRTDAGPSIRAKIMFYYGRRACRSKDSLPVHNQYWRVNGWLDYIRPWYVRRIRK